MSDQKKKKESIAKQSERLIRERYEKMNEPIPVVASVTLPERKLSNCYAAINDEGIRIFEHKDKSVQQIESHEWSKWNKVTLDRYALKTVAEFDNGKVIQFNDGNQDKAFDLIKDKTGIQLERKQRKWYNKILGFRSGKKWKMITASLTYFFIFVAIVGVLGDDDTVEEATAEPEEETEIKETPEEYKSIEVVEENTENDNQETEELSTSEDDFDTESPMALEQDLIDSFTNKFVSIHKKEPKLDGDSYSIVMTGTFDDLLDKDVFQEENYEFVISLSTDEALMSTPVFLLNKFPELEFVELTLEDIFDETFSIHLDRKTMMDTFGIEGTEYRSEDQRSEFSWENDHFDQLVDNSEQWSAVVEQGEQLGEELHVQELKEYAEEVTYRDLSRYADSDLMGTEVTISGEILDLEEGQGMTIIRLIPEGHDYTDFIWVEYEGYIDEYEGDYITVYGWVYGNHTYESLVGEITLPAIIAEVIE